MTNDRAESHLKALTPESVQRIRGPWYAWAFVALVAGLVNVIASTHDLAESAGFDLVMPAVMLIAGIVCLVIFGYIAIVKYQQSGHRPPP